MDVSKDELKRWMLMHPDTVVTGTGKPVYKNGELWVSRLSLRKLGELYNSNVTRFQYSYEYNKEMVRQGLGKDDGHGLTLDAALDHFYTNLDRINCAILLELRPNLKTILLEEWNTAKSGGIVERYLFIQRGGFFHSFYPHKNGPSPIHVMFEQGPDEVPVDIVKLDAYVSFYFQYMQ